MPAEDIENLIQWAKSNGAIISPNIEFVEISPKNISAIYKTRSENPGSLEGNQIRLPINLAITQQNAVESFNHDEKGEFREISKKTSNINSVLKMFLARERTSSYISKSFHKDYLSLLPKLGEINSPYCWNAELKSYLKGTNLGNSLRDNIGQLVEEWWQLINLLPQDLAKPTEHFINMKFYYEYKFYKDEDLYQYFIVDENIENWTSFTNYLWASLILKSRSFPSYLLKGYINDDLVVRRDEVMLLPIVDLLNHDMSAKVNWSVTSSNNQVYFNFKSDSVVEGSQLFNNYGMKGNEELLLAYGFCIEDNSADSSALKIKVPLEILPELEKQGVRFPHINDYTTSVISSETEVVQENSEKNYKQYEDGLLFFITNNHLPENLVELFQFLVKSKLEDHLTLRSKLAGLNQLRQAIESKSNILSNIHLPKGDSENIRNVNIYIQSQKKIFSSTIKRIKSLEKDLLSDPDNKTHFITLKNAYKKDIKFQQSLLVSLGITSYDEILESHFQDQCWLLYLIRCYNRDEYIKMEEDEEENYLPKWIQESFEKLRDQTEVTAVEVLQYKELYQNLIPQLSKIVPEIYSKGKWTVKELVLSAKLLDSISFVRGKEQECILVEPF